MYAKVFAQIYDGTLCTRGPWQALVTFQQLLVLADPDGNVDMTAAAIARRTTIPLEIIEAGIVALLEADPESRTPTEGGRRILPLSEGRSWGWHIVNYKHYRELKREEDRREYHREYWRNKRSTKAASASSDSTTSTQTQHAQQNQPKKETEAEEEAKEGGKKKKTNAPAALVSVSDLTSMGVEEADAASWLAARKAKRLPLTSAALAGVQSEADKAGMTLAQAIGRAAAEGWAGFKAEWLLTSSARPGGANFNKQEALEARNREVGRRWLESMKGKAHD
jgi:hypothetical protein